MFYHILPLCRSELGDLVGIKGRYFYREVPEGENKYIYLEPCARSKIIYGLNKTIDGKLNPLYNIPNQ